jgi:hypothetical protein
MERENEIFFNKQKAPQSEQSWRRQACFQVNDSPRRNVNVKRKFHIVGGERRANLMSFSLAQRQKKGKRES